MKEKRYAIYEGTFTEDGTGDMYYSWKSYDNKEEADEEYSKIIDTFDMDKYLSQLSNKGQGVSYVQFQIIDNQEEYVKNTWIFKR